MTNPAVIEKQLVDIDFSHGVNESPGPETVDWTKWLKRADNVDFSDPGRMTSRPGLYHITGADDVGTVGSFEGILSTPHGVLVASTADYTLRKFNESALTAGTALTQSGYMSEYAVSPLVVAGTSGTAPVIVGTGYTQRMYVISYSNDGGVNYFIAFIDRSTGKTIKNFQIATGTSRAAMTMVSDRYVHFFTGTASVGKVYVFDTTALSTVPSPTTLTSGALVVGAVTMGVFSYVVFANGNISKVTATGTESAAGAVSAGFDTNQIHDVNTDGTDLYIVGRNATPRGIFKVVNSSLSTTRTVTDTDANLATARFSIGVYGGTAQILAFQAISVSSLTLQVCKYLTCSSVGTVFAAKTTLPGMGQVCSPFASSYGPMVALVDLPQVSGTGHNQNAVGGNCALVNLDRTNWYVNQGYGYHLSAVLDGYTDFVGQNAQDSGYLFISQKMFKAAADSEVTIGAVVMSGFNSYSIELRRLSRSNYATTVGAGSDNPGAAQASYADDISRGCVTNSEDIVSGGKTSIFDGYVLSELGSVHTPGIIVKAAGSGSGVNAGVRSYTAIFEFVDAQGRRHLSKCAPAMSLTLGAADNVTVTTTFPSISNHFNTTPSSSGTTAQNYLVKIFRTVAGGTQYYLLSTQTGSDGATTTHYLQFTDSTSDATLIANALLHRQPGTVGTSLDRYTALGSSAVLRHKDRVFYSRGSTVYYSSFNVQGEAPWFNPAFSFEVPGGLGPITAMGSLDGALVIFKRDSVFVVDGDGPPESGGNGTEFSPPRRAATPYGCIATNTLVNADSCLMYASARGIERLNKNFVVDWVGDRVATTVSATLYYRGSAFDPQTGRALWLVESPTGATGYAVVYNVPQNAWSRYIYRGYGGYGYPPYAVCASYGGFAGLGILPKSRFFFVGAGAYPYSGLYAEVARRDVLDTNYFIPVTIETGYVHGASKVDRIKLTDFIISGVRNAAFKVDTYYAADYSPTYISVKSFGSSLTDALTVVQLETQPPKESVQSMSFKIVTSDPTPTSFGTGAQMDIFGLSVRVGLKAGGVKLTSGQKG